MVFGKYKDGGYALSINVKVTFQIWLDGECKRR